MLYIYFGDNIWINMKVHSRYFTLSFALPFFILGTVFALHKVFPFGNRQILIFDFWTQYYPFFSSLWHKLREGTLSIWSWTAGGGHDYVSLIAYYMASPLNLLVLLAPHAWLREILTLLVLIKIGCAGLFTALFLQYQFKQNNTSLTVFSSLYALCAFTLGYYWNIMWLDSFALLPLVMTGFLAFMREGRYRLYICSLALAVFSNFYIGFFICVFIAISFFCLCIIQKLTVREFFLKLGLTAVYSLLALCMTAVLILPTWFALQNTFNSMSVFPSKLVLYDSFFDVMGNFIAFTPPTVLDGLPNLYCGMISIMLAGVFIVSPKVPIREKVLNLAVLGFLILSCNLNVLDYIIHGFAYTNSLPSRFSFLISFVLVVMAYRAFVLFVGLSSNKSGLQKRDFLAMGISAAVFLLAAVFGSQKGKYIIGSAVLCVVYLLLLVVMAVGTGKIKKVMQTVLFLLVMGELSITVWNAVNTAGTSSRDEYPDRYVQIQSLLDRRKLPENDFCRTEIVPYFTLNSSSLYDYNGFSFFSSTFDENVKKYFQALGLIGGGLSNNVIVYNLTSPFTNAILAMRYMIAVGGIPLDAGIFWNAAATEYDTLLLENKYHLPLGFMVHEKTAAYTHHKSNSFLSQNNLFRSATALDGDLFITTDLVVNDFADNSTIMHYEMPHDGILYAQFIYIDFVLNSDDMVEIYLNGYLFRDISVVRNMPCVTVIGNFTQGDIISFISERGTLISAGCLNAPLFEQGYALLADEPLLLTHFSETKVSGTVNALKDGLLYTSIPGKNWNVYVDGTKNELLLIDNAMAAVRLSKGTHNVEFRYINKSFTAGIIVSLVSLTVFIVLIVYKKRKRRVI